MIRILHVEDDGDIREITRIALSLCKDFEVLQCASGQEALELMESYRPDLFLLDLMMPGMTGQQLLDEIRCLKGLQDIPVIFMTARAQEVDVEKLRKAGAMSVIRKPFDPMTLGEVIKSAVSARE